MGVHGYMNKPLKYKAVTVAAVLAHSTKVGAETMEGGRCAEGEDRDARAGSLRPSGIMGSRAGGGVGGDALQACTQGTRWC